MWGKGVSVMSVSATGSYGSDGSSSAEELEIELQTRAAASKQNEERTDRGGAQEVLPDGSVGARDQEAHLVKRAPGAGRDSESERDSLGRRRPEALYKSSKQKPH